MEKIILLFLIIFGIYFYFLVQQSNKNIKNLNEAFDNNTTIVCGKNREAVNISTFKKISDRSISDGHHIYIINDECHEIR